MSAWRSCIKTSARGHNRTDMNLTSKRSLITGVGASLNPIAIVSLAPWHRLTLVSIK